MTVQGDRGERFNSRNRKRENRRQTTGTKAADVPGDSTRPRAPGRRFVGSAPGTSSGPQRRLRRGKSGSPGGNGGEVNGRLRLDHATFLDREADRHKNTNSSWMNPI